MRKQHAGQLAEGATAEVTDLKSFVVQQMRDTSNKGIRARNWGLCSNLASVGALCAMWWMYGGGLRELAAWTPGATISVAIPILVFLALWLTGRGLLAVGAAYGLRSGQWSDVYAYPLAGCSDAIDAEKFLAALVAAGRNTSPRMCGPRWHASSVESTLRA
jgi:hypothetical protein